MVKFWEKYWRELFCYLTVMVVLFINYGHLFWAEETFSLNFWVATKIGASKFFFKFLATVGLILFIVILLGHHTATIGKEFSYGYKANKNVKDWLCAEYKDWLDMNEGDLVLARILGSIQGSLLRTTQNLGTFSKPGNGQYKTITFKPNWRTHCSAVSCGIQRILHWKFWLSAYIPSILVTWAIYTTLFL